MKLTAMSQSTFDYIKDNGGKISIEELCTALARAPRSINASVTDLQKKGLVVREKVTAEGAEKEVTYAVITDEGKAFVPSED